MNIIQVKQLQIKKSHNLIQLKLTFFIFCCFFIPMIMYSNSANAEKMKNILLRGTFEICVSPRAMPLSDLQASLETKNAGIEIDFGKAISQALEVKLKTTWISYRYHAKYTKCDAFLSVARLKNEIENIYLKKTIPFFKVEMLLATKKAISLKELKDFKNLKVAVTNGSVAHDALINSGAKFFVSYRTDEDKLNALEKGAVDVALVTNLGLGWHKKKYPNLKYNKTSTSIITDQYEYDLAIGLRRADRMTVRDFNDLITEMISNGTLASIFNTYGVTYKVNKWEGEFIH